ncbi:heavy metal transport/detoxification protein [Thermoanaerobacterium thermosaccharolyticum]|uniref:Copper chaperone CopZ n=1 Tax=Thermoanaerobacterium thermosaccharolyticum TaxID=1517 RepID=A0A231VLK5_THETR|nr:copper chaperone CopZ [Thermoanaerobacterium thermosaccharolyticum]OXT09123.1 heavy metal transport/detoxification protein [Thermoanaerobacterium thermosaccharolyticum]
MSLFGPKGETTTIDVKGMSCNHCKMTVEKSLKALDGVSKATVDLDKANVTVTYDPKKVTIDEMKKAIIDAGYEA